MLLEQPSNDKIEQPRLQYRDETKIRAQDLIVNDYGS